jgi:hypothetical protein
MNLQEEEILKLASLGNHANLENAVDVLKRSLALRNRFNSLTFLYQHAVCVGYFFPKREMEPWLLYREMHTTFFLFI